MAYLESKSTSWLSQALQACHSLLSAAKELALPSICSSPCLSVQLACSKASYVPLNSSCAGLCRRRGWRDPLYECYRSHSGCTCQVIVNGREYITDLAYESDGLAQENAAMRAYMVCRNFSVNGGMLARNGVVQGLHMSTVADTRDSRQIAIMADD